MTNTDSKMSTKPGKVSPKGTSASHAEIIDAILKNRKIIKNGIHLKQFKDHLIKEEIKKLQKPITDKLDNITELASLIHNSGEANLDKNNVLAIEENVSKNGPQAKGKTEGDDVSVPERDYGSAGESDQLLLSLPKSPSILSLDPDKDLNFDVIEKKFKFEKPSHLLSLDNRNRNAKIDTTIPEISTKLKSLNAHITNAKKSQEQEKIDNLQYVYSQLKKYKRALEDIRKIPFYEKQRTGSSIFSDPNEMASLKGLVQRMSKDPREHKQNEIRKDGVRVEQDWKILKLPNGLYDENELNNYIQEYFGTSDSPPFYFDVNYATNRFMLIIRDIDCEIDFSHGKIHQLLGFDKKIYKQGINYATKIGNITKDIDQILIHCSLISSSYQNNLKSDVMYAFTPNISPRSLINIEPTHPKYLPINRTDYIFHIRISVTNQLNQLINFNGECLNFVLDIQ
ncbi:hypothetical protein Zmor_006115 [Zophobas morio]|uniref:Uncharacterized protein n=1 Tax=Zophobas morio TaxID=2755281 RepID=A0AA38IU54_9CUCU|nr:hypothetical protein Zmor_006115 [Zophobas morio]